MCKTILTLSCLVFCVSDLGLSHRLGDNPVFPNSTGTEAITANFLPVIKHVENVQTEISCEDAACNISTNALIYLAKIRQNDGLPRRFIPIGTPTIFRNYGGVAVEQKHQAFTTINEFLEISRPYWLDFIRSSIIAEDFSVEFENYFEPTGPFINDLFLREHIPKFLMSPNLTYMYKKVTEFRIENSLQLSPCTSYKANASVEVLEVNYWYQLHAIMSATYSNGTQVPASIVESLIPDYLDCETWGDYDLSCCSYDNIRTVYGGLVSSDGHAETLSPC